MLQVDGLSVSYGRINAVRSVSLNVGEREIVALIGANGAGKTTTVRAVSGLLPARGSIRYRGQELLGKSPSGIVRAGIVQVPEGRQVFARLTVRENLVLGGYLIRDRQLLAQRVGFVEELFPILAERKNQKAGNLSGGEQQMLAIGRALISGGRTLLLDEPSLGLAPAVVAQVFQVIERLREEGYAILLIEQNAAEALRVADRAYIMECGEIRLSGTGAELREDRSVQDIYLGGSAS